MVRLTRRRDASPALVLDASAFKILWLVVEEGPHTLRALADGLQLDQSTINRQVHAVVRRGLAERHEADGAPAMLIRATSEGEAAYRHDAGIRAEGLREVVDTVGERATADLVAGLALLNDAIDAATEKRPPLTGSRVTTPAPGAPRRRRGRPRRCARPGRRPGW